MPQLRRERGGNNGACPDAATVLAVIEGEADEWLRSAYAQHLTECSACLDLDSRLRHFDHPVLADEGEWRQTEKRLDNWMTAFLELKPTVPFPQPVETRVAPAGFWQSVWSRGAVWKISLATALLALVAVGVDVYLRLQPPLQPDRAKATTSASPAAELKAVPPPLENAQPKTEPAKSTESQTPTPAAPATPSGAAYQHGPMAAAPKASPAIKPQQKPEETATVANKTGSSEPQRQAALEPPPASQKAEIALSAPEPKPVAEAPALGRTYSVRPASSTSAGEAQPSSTVQAPESATSATRSGVPKLPSSLHLASGARLWITLDSVNRQPDGAFSFSGSLLLPLSASGSSQLDRGTEVSGSGNEAQGRTSLVILEIIVQGSHYKLKSKTGGKVRTAGSGGAVSFDSGKVLEVWLSSDSIYECSTAESPQ